MSHKLRVLAKGFLADHRGFTPRNITVPECPAQAIRSFDEGCRILTATIRTVFVENPDRRDFIERHAVCFRDDGQFFEWEWSPIMRAVCDSFSVFADREDVRAT
jgi:hypothetical protein